MGFDADVYTRDSHPPPEKLLPAGCSVRRGEDGQLLVSRDNALLFAVWGPKPVEAEDVAEEIAPLIPGARLLWQVGVEGSAPERVEPAVAFARALADAAGGGVYDQVHGLWVGGRIRRPRRTRERRVDVVTLTWYAHVDRRPTDLGTLWLELCRRHYPAALPRRFGATEPLLGRLDRDGDLGFVAAAEGEHGVYLVGTGPVYGGSLSGPWPSRMGPVARHTLTVDRAVGQDVAVLFVTVAEAAGCHLAVADVVREMVWTGRTLVFEAGTERPPPPLLGRWPGLPPRLSAWTWFGPPYDRLVRSHLPTAEPTPGGLLHRWAPRPLDADELRTAAPSSWLPTDLLARLDADTLGGERVEPARRIPRLVPRRPFWGR
jgi:hypothetical protein